MSNHILTYFNMFATFFDATKIVFHTCNSIGVICLNVSQEYNDVKLSSIAFLKKHGLRKKLKNSVKRKNIKVKSFQYSNFFTS